MREQVKREKPPRVRPSKLGYFAGGITRKMFKGGAGAAALKSYAGRMPQR
jgi:hypothetical protein